MHCTFEFSRYTGGVIARGVISCPSATAKVELYKNDMGWSLDKSVDRFFLPAGITVTPPANETVGLFTRLPKATVPSWQERHNIEEPSGCPGMAFKVELLYSV